MAIGLGTTLSSPPSIFFGSSHCQFCNTEGVCCSMSTGTATVWIRSPFDNRRTSDLSSVRCRNPFLGTVHSQWLPTGHEVSLSKVSVAADYPDSVPESSNYIKSRGYHPLEELKENERNRDKVLTDAEIARTTLEANSSAMLVFPGMVHCEPHQHISWTEFQYVIDDYGDVFFEIFDDENILQDPGASSPVNVLIGMDLAVYGGNKRTSGNYIEHSDSSSVNDFSFDSDNKETGDTEVASTLISWGMPDTLRRVHPVFFAKRLSKAVDAKYYRKMEHPSNGLSIVGCLRPAFIDEESYLRKLFHGEDGDGYVSDWRDDSEKEEEQMAATYNLIDGEILSFSSKDYGGNISSTLYKLEIMRVELFSVYGDQPMISLQAFQDAEPDILVHSASTIIKHFTEYGMKSNIALKALCRKKKGLNVEGANLIGVDSLGMDVRVFSGVEAQTIRFSFKDRAMSGSAAEKRIRQMLFPRYYRKNYRTSGNGRWDPHSF
ncbi:pentatricopeptide repeat (PPR) superfamily protein isoform X2 [Tasmannia lanceolata]|uniref:pentatricopeptide repeat (PPR) superfamily protein isoform X2 n=1 Tax=Tasmannia lanceolata TaxID=3420 RepID=UPI004063B78D